MLVVVGIDASWTGIGYTVATAEQPLLVGHCALGSSKYRTAKLRAFLHGPLSAALADAQLRAGADGRVRVVVEVPPIAFKAGKKTAYLAIGRLVGMIEVWACRPGLAYPWLFEPQIWRAWWGIAPSGRNRTGEVLKREAIQRVQATWGRDVLAQYPLGKPIKDPRAPAGYPGIPAAGPRGDVAESILIAVGAARHDSEGPRSPARGWPDPPAVSEYMPPAPV